MITTGAEPLRSAALERSSAAQRDAKRAKIVGTDHAVVCLGRVLCHHAVHEERHCGKIAIHRDHVGRCDGANTGERRDSGPHLVVEVLNRGAAAVSRTRKRQPDGQDLRRTESGIDRLHVLEAARQQHGGDEQDRRQRDLGEHERGRMRSPPALEPRPPCCSAPRRSPLTACSAGATPTIRLAPSDTAA